MLTHVFFSQEEVAMGAGYANQGFYSLENRKVDESPLDNWTLLLKPVHKVRLFE